MRFHGIPNASYLGFTGTPIIKEELELTKNIFVNMFQSMILNEQLTMEQLFHCAI
jgi:hypothetical protein